MFYDDSSIIDDNDDNDNDDDVEAVLACPCFKHLFWPVFITRLWMGMVANSSYSVGRFIRTFEDVCETQIVDSFNHKMGALFGNQLPYEPASKHAMKKRRRGKQLCWKTQKTVSSDGTRPKATPPFELKVLTCSILERFAFICSIFGQLITVLSANVARGDSISHQWGSLRWRIQTHVCIPYSTLCFMCIFIFARFFLVTAMALSIQLEQICVY